MPKPQRGRYVFRIVGAKTLVSETDTSAHVAVIDCPIVVDHRPRNVTFENGVQIMVLPTTTSWRGYLPIGTLHLYVGHPRVPLAFDDPRAVEAFAALATQWRLAQTCGARR